MAPLEGDTLGKKHRHYNRLVDEALKSNQLLQPIEEANDDDVQNLLKIDVACRNRNVEYILDVLKSEDQLYVSKAIKRSTWLFTDPQYAHIINPDHLYTKLYPQMTTKAFNKLMLNIRLHLKDEKRVEAFYQYIKEKNVKTAHKWLQHCSLALVVKEVANAKGTISMNILLRLFKKSFSVYEAHVKSQGYYYFWREPKFIAIRYPEEILDLLESLENGFHYRFDQKETKTLMEKCPEKLLSKFVLFAKCLHLATFTKLLKKRQDIEEFLLQHAESNKLTWLYAYDKIQHFIKQLPKESKFEFVKKVFIEKNVCENHKYQKIIHRAEEHLSDVRSQNTNIYMWYKFAPFEIAFTELRKLIRAESLPHLRNSMLQVLLCSAGRGDMQHIQTVLQYYHDKHINEPFKFKIQFVNSFLSKIDFATLDDQSWDTLTQLFHSMEVFIESENNVQSCIKAIIIRSSIRNEQVPDLIKNKFIFDTLKANQTTLKKQEKEAVFRYLRDFITAKINLLNLTVISEFDEAVTLCEQLLNLIRDWGKELQDYPYALDRVKELIKVKKEKQWWRDLARLYNIKKSWRKAMFEESITITQTEKVCINALKHDPGLLSRNGELVLDMCSNDYISLRNLLKKIRIYWHHTLAEEWKTIYLNRLDQPGSHKSLIVGLCTLLPSKSINELLKKYAPFEKKIDWNATDQIQLSLRKQIAKNIHKARPPPPVEGVLLYAKGDYLQYAAPSINAILSQLSRDKSRLYIPKLLDAPVSLQKFGLRCAIHKLPFEELKKLLSEIWNSTKKSSIRTVLFTQTFQMLCKEKNDFDVKDTWALLSMFIDRLTPDDNRLLFKKLGEVYKVPESIKPQFYIKSYTFLSSLPAKSNCESILKNIHYLAKEYMELFDEDFVIKIMLKNFNKVMITKEDNSYFDIENIIAIFILASKDEETQIRRYENTLKILLDQFLPQWEMIYEGKYRVKLLIVSILEKLVYNMDTFTFEKNLQVPAKIFEIIQYKLEKELSYKKQYVFLTTWKLVTTYVKILNDNKHVLKDSDQKVSDEMTDEEKYKRYTTIHQKLAPLFAKLCVQYLKEDLLRFGKSIHSLFAAAIRILFRNYVGETVCPVEHRLLYQKCLLQCGNEKELCLLVRDIIVKDMQNYNYCKPEGKQLFKEIYDTVKSRCSEEIQMHFYKAFEHAAIPDSNQTP